MSKKYKKVPVILQMEALECGASSLAMVLAYYKRYIPLEQLRADCGVSRDGSKASNILKAARFHGMKAKGYRYSVEKIKELKTFPAIIHWDFNHFVVLDGFKKDKAVINDPASGIIEVSMENFEKSFTGVTLVMEPDETFEEYGSKKSTLSFLRDYISKYKAALTAIILCGFMIALLGIGMPVFSKVFMDNVLLSSADEWMNYLIKAMSIILIMLFILKMILSVLLYRAKRIMSTQMNIEFMWHMLRLPVAFFNQRSPGDLCNRQQDNDEVTEIMFETLAPMVINVLMAAIYFVLLMILNYKMAFIALCAAFIQIAFLKLMNKRSVIESKNISRDEGKYAGAAMTGISMIETIKASGAEEGYFRKTIGYLTKYNNSKTRLKVRNISVDFLSRFLTKLCNALVLITGVYYILAGQLTIGLLLAFQGFLAQFISPVETMMLAGDELTQVTSKLERINDVFDYKEDVSDDMCLFDDEHSNEKENCQRLSGKVEFQNVNYAYGRLSPLFIEDFNLTIMPGETVALVGGSGSGKSTIASLITGINALRSGKILFDGKERTQIDRYIFTQSVGIVSQDITLFKDTIRNNLTLWDETIDDQTIIDACKAACIYDEIMMRPEGLNYILDKNGENLSGGQRQRMEIARALIKNPSILILDEATSALDVITEKKIMATLQTRNMTCIIIAHRLSTIKNADKIIMLEYGKVIEMGNHESLMKENGPYASLVTDE